MTHNNLFLHRLLIITDEGLEAYNERFHKGINIIRGNNSSGKSTITHFIFYVLGGDFNDFVPEARLCSKVYAEVEMNDAIFTIRREIEKDEEDKIAKQAPMFIFWGGLDESLSMAKGKSWQKYGYRTTDSRKSFSNVLFNNLGLPIVKGENNITFHQILRLLYIDQESPTSSLFYYEYFDSQLTRETVADLLLGVYNEELYENKKRLVSAERELNDIKSEIKAAKRFFSDPLTLLPSHILTIIDNKENEISKIEEKIISIRSSEMQPVYKGKTRLQFEVLNEESIKQRNRVNDLRNKLDLLQNEIYDSEYYLETLNSKITALRNSIKTREFLGNIPLEYCPDCLTKINPDSSWSGKCKLCKEDIDDSFGTVQARRMEQEVSFQIIESNKILKDNYDKLNKLDSTYKSEIVKLHQIQRQVNFALSEVRSLNQETLDKLLQDKGFIEGEILQYKTLLENALLFEKLRKKEADLKTEINYLELFIKKAEVEQLNSKNSINETIRKEGVYLLNNDLERQDDFKNADEFYIDFPNNIAYLSNKYSKYSASSNFYLKVSARFAIFLASLSVPRMRYPRFIFADNMEDKGIEKERAQNLQKILIKRLSKFSSDSYQMIYTTSYITEELNNSDFVVGPFYTKSNPSLKNIRK